MASEPTQQPTKNCKIDNNKNNSNNNNNELIETETRQVLLFAKSEKNV